MADRVAESEDRRRFRELMDRSSLGPIDDAPREPFSAPPKVSCSWQPGELACGERAEYVLTVADCDGEQRYSCADDLARSIDDLHENYGADVVVRAWP